MFTGLLDSLWEPEKSHRIKMKVMETLKKPENFKLIEGKFIETARLFI